MTAEDVDASEVADVDVEVIVADEAPVVILDIDDLERKLLLEGVARSCGACFVRPLMVPLGAVMVPCRVALLPVD